MGMLPTGTKVNNGADFRRRPVSDSIRITARSPESRLSTSPYWPSGVSAIKPGFRPTATAATTRCVSISSTVTSPASGLVMNRCSDDAAIAPDKTALLPMQTARFANYTSFDKGINGIMVDIAGATDPASLGAADFRLIIS